MSTPNLYALCSRIVIQCTKSKVLQTQDQSNMHPTFSPTHFSFFFTLINPIGAAIYYLNLACTPLLLSKISPTLHPTFQMHPTFYIMISLTPHFLPSLLYYSCTTFSPVSCILHHTFRSIFKVNHILKHIYFTKAIFTNNILNILNIQGLFG